MSSSRCAFAFIPTLMTMYPGSKYAVPCLERLSSLVRPDALSIRVWGHCRSPLACTFHSEPKNWELSKEIDFSNNETDLGTDANVLNRA